VTHVVRSLQLDRRGRNRVSVRFEAGSGLAVDRNLAAQLHIGQVLSEDEIARLEAEDVVEQAVRWAVGLVARRPRSEAEIRQGLRKKKIEIVQQDRVIDRMRTQGWLDDRAFADAWVDNRRAFRPRSTQALRAELRQKGVGTEDIEAALAGHDDEAAAADAARKAARRWSSLNPEAFRQRLVGYLMRRGFDYRTSASTARMVREELAGGGEETEVGCSTTH
jgi:regulatory protein